MRDLHDDIWWLTGSIFGLLASTISLKMLITATSPSLWLFKILVFILIAFVAFSATIAFEYLIKIIFKNNNDWKNILRQSLQISILTVALTVLQRFQLLNFWTGIEILFLFAAWEWSWVTYFKNT